MATNDPYSRPIHATRPDAVTQNEFYGTKATDKVLVHGAGPRNVAPAYGRYSTAPVGGSLIVPQTSPELNKPEPKPKSEPRPEPVKFRGCSFEDCRGRALRSSAYCMVHDPESGAKRLANWRAAKAAGSTVELTEEDLFG